MFVLLLYMCFYYNISRAVYRLLRALCYYFLRLLALFSFSSSPFMFTLSVSIPFRRHDL